MSFFDEKKIVSYKVQEQVRCSTCLEDKKVKESFTFNCGHTICRDCYSSQEDRQKCVECHSYIIDRGVAKNFDRVIKCYTKGIAFDILYIALMLVIFKNFKSAAYVLYGVDFLAAVFLTIMLLKYKVDIPSLKYNWVTTALRINWIVYFAVTQTAWWKAVVISISKIILICMTVLFESYRDKIESCYRNEEAVDNFYSFQIRIE